MWNIGNPNVPINLGAFSTSTTIKVITTTSDSNYAIVGTTTGWTMYNIANPASITAVITKSYAANF